MWESVQRVQVGRSVHSPRLDPMLTLADRNKVASQFLSYLMRFPRSLASLLSDFGSVINSPSVLLHAIVIRIDLPNNLNVRISKVRVLPIPKSQTSVSLYSAFKIEERGTYA